MEKRIYETIKQILYRNRKESWRKALTALIACAVVFFVVSSLVLPAITIENRNENITENAMQAFSVSDKATPKMKRAWTRSGTVYSSDLADFVTQVVITDANGNEIPQNGTVYIGESYDIKISFSENNISGQEKQFAYNNDGFLTYQIPSLFECSQVTNGVLTDSTGAAVGNYYIDSGGLLRVRFIDGYIDSTKASMTITLSSTAGSSSGTGIKPIDFGGYIIEVNVSGAGLLDVEKTAGNYDARTHSIDYEVKVTARCGTVSNITYTDTPTSSGLTVDQNSIIYTSLDGLTVYQTMPTSLAAGEGFLVKYKAYLAPGIYQNETIDYKAKNKAVVTGTNDDGAVSAEDTEEKRIKTSFLEKKGKDEPGHSRIRWTVTVGDGSSVVDGMTVTDLPGSGLSFDTQSGITAVPWIYTQTGELVEGTALNIPFGANPSSITLPTGIGAYKYVLQYNTDYTLNAGVTTQDFTNTVSVNHPTHGVIQKETTVTGHAVGAPPEISKTVEKNAAANSLHYSIDIEVPGFYAGTKGFYLYDSYTKVTFAGTEYFFGRDLENLTVYTENAYGAIGTYSPYSGGSTDYTYLVGTSSDPRSIYFYFNTNSASSSKSNWIETDDVTLHIEYDLPLDSTVYTRENGVYETADTDLQYLISEELSLLNRARLYYSEGAMYVEDNAEYREVSDKPFRKSGSVNGDGTIDYYVVFSNRDENFNTVLQRKMKQLIFHDTLVSPGMSYVDGSLYCDMYNTDLSRIRATYLYSQSISAYTTLSASAEYFEFFSGDSGAYPTLYEAAQHSTLAGSSTSSSRLVFRYKVRVDPENAIFQNGDASAPLSNTARLTGIMPDNSPFDTGPADCTVQYDIDMVKKEVEHSQGSNRADFTITLNPSGIDILEDATSMTVVDRMTANLRIVLSTIKVYQKQAGDWVEMTPIYTYDEAQNSLSFILPDNVPIKITYTTLITETGEGVNIGNSIVIDGFSEYSSVINTEFNVDDTGGAASADNFSMTVLKQASDTHLPLSGAVFALYGPQNSERQGTPPAGTPGSITVSGITLWYYESYTTLSDGTAHIEKNNNGVAMFSVQGLYALKEITAPSGYHLATDPICFYADERPDGGIASVPVVLSETPAVVPNDPFTYSLPATGGSGTVMIRASGALLLLVSAWYFIRKKAGADTIRA